ncbi:MAG: hypothetical protein SF162_20850 [bacterium]|nr:hypothetical protein [bacterium]
MFRRSIQALTFVIAACLIGGGYLALRAIVWHYESEAATAASIGVISAAVVSGCVAVLYVLLGQRVFAWISIQIDWMSVQLGMIGGAMLYGAYSLFASPVGTSADAGARALQGAMDGLVLGAFYGLLTFIASGRRVRISPNGLVGYCAVFVVLLCAVQLSGAVAAWGGVFRDAAWAVTIPAVVAFTRLGVHLFMRKPLSAPKPVEPDPAPDEWGAFEQN